MFLDRDEFLDVRGPGGGTGSDGLAEALAAVPAAAPGVRLSMRNYHAPTPASAPHANPVQRLVLRDPAEIGVGKVAVRRHRNVVVDAGNHRFTLEGIHHAGAAQEVIRIAHHLDHSPYQMAFKAVVGRLKVITAGRANWIADEPRIMPQSRTQCWPTCRAGYATRRPPPPHAAAGDEAARFAALLLQSHEAQRIALDAALEMHRAL